MGLPILLQDEASVLCDFFQEVLKPVFLVGAVHEFSKEFAFAVGTHILKRIVG